MSVRIKALFVQNEKAADEARISLEENEKMSASVEAGSLAKSQALHEASEALEEMKKANETAKNEERLRIENENRERENRENLIQAIAGRINTTVDKVIEDVTVTSKKMLENAEKSENIVNMNQAEMQDVMTVTTQSDAMISDVSRATNALSQASAEISQKMKIALKVAGDAAGESKHGGELARSLKDAAEKIGGVLTIIETVADQTRLLALNAAIEAARAGDSGRGFAVVAEIVEVVDEMRSASTEVSSTLEKIETSVMRLTSAATEVSSAVEKQTNETKTIALSIDDVAQGSRQIRTSIEKMARDGMIVKTSSRSVVEGAQSVADQNSELAEKINAISVDLINSRGSVAVA